MIHEERVRKLNQNKLRNGRYVLYWMQSSQRAHYNHALEYSIDKANSINKPVIVYFGLTEYFPEANERHYFFMLEGLREVEFALTDRGIQLVVLQESPAHGAINVAKDASLAVVDRGYLQIERKWRSQVAESISCPLIQVESDVVVPLEEASPKEEYSAATFRPKITKKLARYLVPLNEKTPIVKSLELSFDFPSFDIDDTKEALNRLDIDRTVCLVKDLHGGIHEAQRRLQDFLQHGLEQYSEQRNDPTKAVLSDMSPFLHFGQISPLYIALKVAATDSPGKEAYLEELIVRRELARNFVFYNQDYHSFKCLPSWAKKTLNKHSKDYRSYIYTSLELERGETHDKYWNAAQQEMKDKGKMHGYMRMYWGKKILEWSRTPQEAFVIALYLNNKYELDGRDANGYAGVAWCFGKHDRPWKERDVFGKVRYMSENGLKRKFNAEKYADLNLPSDNYT
ncbi:MAG: deoxyribodipyrimidine photo-lyase [Candidatus Bathyarchaeota archaeon]|nr:MAG: deoxyribodipyrimidine photo-lyase [Candidatus Bathyarchaeota archaeon]